ncbi:hypothetical protein HF521_008845 [Silurus meridionalis]|uniref:DAN domain-containing protein n=1 Tax=Silurus meridionalis TaxID=175797 RepID=A0A8T0ALH8_SILME|nr:hypothetical protein HF521_008845 [Silurus meridionalis]
MVATVSGEVSTRSSRRRFGGSARWSRRYTVFLAVRARADDNSSPVGAQPCQRNSLPQPGPSEKWAGVTVTAFSLPGESPSALYSLFLDLPSSSSSSSSSSPAGVPECVCCAPVIGAAMLLIGCVLLAVCSAAPPAHINRLALFPDKSAWCEAKNITQIVGHTGCVSQSIQNRACLGQCFSYSVPNTFPQSTESLVHCDSCKPAQTQWEVEKDSGIIQHQHEHHYHTT